MKTIALIITVVALTAWLSITGLYTVDTVESIVTARYSAIEAIN